VVRKLVAFRREGTIKSSRLQAKARPELEELGVQLPLFSGVAALRLNPDWWCVCKTCDGEDQVQ
jgi:hypothetical protein